jgi:GT2 family glycosyltransferase/SAM-dependent methyltransferase
MVSDPPAQGHQKSEPQTPPKEGETSVAVVVTTFNHAHFLHDSLKSVLNQSRRADEIVVVDDGSTDDPAAVVEQFAGVQLIQQPNRGLSAARNRGLAACISKYVIFLDADDLLEPDAIAAGLRSFENNPECAFVYGGHRHVTAQGSPLWAERLEALVEDPYVQLLRGNFIAMHATVMYRRTCLVGIGGFDEGLRRCEDYDVYLRIARANPIAAHENLVASYRWHGSNMSADAASMLDAALLVHNRHRPPASTSREIIAAWREGRASWRRYYGREMVKQASRVRSQGRNPGRVLSLLAVATMRAPASVVEVALKRLARAAKGVAPQGITRLLQRPFDSGRPPPVGHVRFGDFQRTSPVSSQFGFDRGIPIDRWYIEAFLSDHRSDIRGRVLEIGDSSYSSRFGGDRIERQEVLHVHGGNPAATIIGDLAAPGTVPEDSMDCMILTQTLHLVYDFHSAAQQAFNALRPGGVLLLTVPGISQIDRGEWKENWCWAFTPKSAETLFGGIFGEGRIEVRSYGSVYAAVSFLQGLSLSDIDRKKLAVQDESYPVIVAVRARKGLECET